MKKVVRILLIAAMLVGLFAVRSVSAQKAVTGKKMALVVKFLGNPMFMHLKEVMEEAVVDSGNTLDTYDAANDAQKEANLFADLITNQYDAIFIAAVDYVASAPLIDQANEAGIPIAVVDSAVIGFENATFSVMSDNVKAGEIAMEALAKYMDYKGKMIIFENRMSYAVSQRSIGRDNVLRKYRDIQVVNTMNSPSSIDQAMFAMDNFLQADPDITGAWGGNDLCAQGFVAAAKSAGKEAGDIGIVGIDGSVDSIALIKEGWQTATSAQSFGKIGRASVEMMLKVLAGEELEERDILIPVELVDAENVEDYVFD